MKRLPTLLLTLVFAYSVFGLENADTRMNASVELSQVIDTETKQELHAASKQGTSAELWLYGISTTQHNTTINSAATAHINTSITAAATGCNMAGSTASSKQSTDKSANRASIKMLSVDSTSDSLKLKPYGVLKSETGDSLSFKTNGGNIPKANDNLQFNPSSGIQSATGDSLSSNADNGGDNQIEAESILSDKAAPQRACGYSGTAPYRHEFISYNTRHAAVDDLRDEVPFYMPIDKFTLTEHEGRKRYTAQIEIPFYWTERVVFIHTEGARNSHKVFLNDTFIGSARDSRTPSEFDITKHIISGTNTLTIDVMTDTREPETALPEDARLDLQNTFLYSQPRLRIQDYEFKAKIDKKNVGRLLLDVTVTNSYNYDETVTVGYDIFSPQGRLVEYNLKSTTIPGNGSTIVAFNADIYGAAKNLWSPESPALYYIMLFIRRNGIITEYIPLNIGFVTREWDEENVYINGNKIKISAVRYNAAATYNQTLKEIRAYKKTKVNTLYPDYPQPYWFYDICDSEGIYVIDKVNINSAYEIGNQSLGGTLSNAPEWQAEYLERTKAAFYRSRGHACIIGWATGNDSGNGYNIQKAYLWLKEHDSERPVVYNGAYGEWNSDFTLPLPLSVTIHDSKNKRKQ